MPTGSKAPTISARVSTRAKSFAFYVRDSRQVSRKLTVNYGARWDFFPFPRRKDTGLEIYDPKTATTSICGIGSVPGDGGITRDKQRIVPRLGIAYRLTDSTVIRAGYAQVTNPIAFLGQTLSSRENFPYLFSPAEGKLCARRVAHKILYACGCSGVPARAAFMPRTSGDPS